MSTIRRLALILVGSLLLAAPAASPVFAKAKKTTKTTKKTTKKTTAPAAPKKPPTMAVDNRKKLDSLFGEFKFGMTKDEVVGVYAKEINAKFDEKIKQTSDVAAQDRLRADRKKETKALSSSYVEFNGKKTGWDVSIIEEEFAHNTGESMLEKWENKDGKNNRHFFFFKDGQLYKMFVSLDLTILPEDERTTETFQKVMQGAYGNGLIEANTITWVTADATIRAVDKLKQLSALGVVLEQTATVKELVAIREEKAPKKDQGSSIIKAVVDTDGTDAPDVKQNSNAVDSVIKAQGGSGTKKKN
jgi:hypothetical protein